MLRHLFPTSSHRLAPFRTPSLIYRLVTTTTPHASPSPPNPEALSADTVMGMSSNKATRFVYLRTLPLVAQPELSGQVDLIASTIESTTKSVCQKHAASLIDDRSAVHLHTAALAIATHRVLAPRIKNECRVSNIIRAGFGAQLLSDPEADGKEKESNVRMHETEKRRPDFWIVRAALWFAFDRMKAIRRMTANMATDFGASFQTEAMDQGVGEEGNRNHSFRVYKCYYNDICRAEGLPQLTKVFCALDRAIYSPITVKSHGISFTLDRTLADDEVATGTKPACEFNFTQQKEK